MEAAVNEAVDQLLRFGPLVALAVTAAWLAFATRRTAASIGIRAYGFGTSVRQQLARLLLAGSIVGDLLALMANATGSTSAFLDAMTGEASLVRLAGLGLAVGGQALTLFAQGDMGRRWRVGVPETAPDALVTTGLFGLSRNPVFLGMLAMAGGLAVAVPSPATIVCAVAFWIACEIQVRDEERFLQHSFGPACGASRTGSLSNPGRRWTSLPAAPTSCCSIRRPRADLPRPGGRRGDAPTSSVENARVIPSLIAPSVDLVH